MGLSGTELATNLHNASSGMLLDIGVFTLMIIIFRIHILEFLRCDKGYIFIQLGMKLRISDLQSFIGAADSVYDRTDDQLKVIKISVFLCNDFLPVPLINID